MKFTGMLAICFLFLLAAHAGKRPNIIMILSDDAGFEEFGINDVKKGEPSNTPNIDKLGERGVAFAHCWGQAICGLLPSRTDVRAALHDKGI